MPNMPKITRPIVSVLDFRRLFHAQLPFSLSTIFELIGKDCHKFVAPNNLTNNNASNGNGLSSSSTDKDSLTPSPPNRLSDDVKSEPMELVCGNHNLPSDEQSNDSVGDHESKYLGVNDGKGSLRYTNYGENVCGIITEIALESAINNHFCILHSLLIQFKQRRR